MADVSGVLVVIGFVVAIIATYRMSRGRIWTAQWLAFSFTAGAALLIGAALIGVTLGHRPETSAQRQAVVGVLLLAVAGICWWKALRSGRLPK